MASLSEEQKAFVVRRLACFDRLVDVQEAVKREYGLECSLQQLQHYKPGTVQGRRLANKWEELFEETRRKFVEDTSDQAVAQKAWRLKQLEKGVRKYMAMGEYEKAAHLIKIAAKETGGKFTNDVNVDHSGEVNVIGIDVVPPDDDDQD